MSKLKSHRHEKALAEALAIMNEAEPVRPGLRIEQPQTTVPQVLQK